MCAFFLLVAFLSYDCSSNSAPTLDTNNTEDITKNDSGKLWPCENPEETCNAHDPCAINPICGKDGFCHPASIQNCDDGLDCTEDSCKGNGLCENIPKEGFCALNITIKNPTTDAGIDLDAGSDAGMQTNSIQCFTKDETDPGNPCKKCNPTASKTEWTSITGGSCDDENDCTKDDMCQKGICVGTDFSNICADDYYCTTELCDGKGGCLGHQLKSDWCFIDDECFKNGQRDNSQCNVCDVSIDQHAWTPVANVCMIDDYCYDLGVTNGTACAICDPTQNDHDWTVPSGNCRIYEKCYKDGDQHPQGCAKCDSNVNRIAWTPYNDYCIIRNICYSAHTKDISECAECDPAKSQTEWTLLDDVCFIAPQCYSNQTMHALGCAKCDTAITKNAWTVIGDQCLIDDKCYHSGYKTFYDYKVCDPARSKTSWSVALDRCIIDGKYLKDKNPHPQQSCAICDITVSNTAWTIDSNFCFIDDTCIASGTTHNAGCAICDPIQSQTAWTPLSGKCLINDQCYSAGDQHPLGCAVCDPATSTTSWKITTNECLIDDICYLPGAIDPSACKKCDTTKSKTQWTEISGCYNIVMTALNDPHNGNLNGIDNADMLCTKEAIAAGFSGKFKAFLSDQIQHVKKLITGINATSIPVVTTKGEKLYNSWNEMFASTKWANPNYWISTFDGSKIDSNHPLGKWGTLCAWHGSFPAGSTNYGNNCHDWYYDGFYGWGAYGELNPNEDMWLSTWLSSCNAACAVVCIKVP